MKNSQVAHVWAQQRKESGKGSHFYFEGPTIYSYGPHFPIARFVRNDNGKDTLGQSAVLLTTDTRSVSTAKHINYVRRALSGLDIPVFNVLEVSEIVSADTVSHSVNRSGYESRIRNALDLVGKARKRQIEHIGVAASIAREANQYAEFFGLEWRSEIPEASPELIARYENAEKDRKAKERERAAKALLIEKANREDWRAHRGIESHYFDNPTMLRVHGDAVQTSRGASVPAAHARRLFKHIKQCHDTGTEWHTNGHTLHVGEFSVSRIDADGTAHIGCHRLEWSEIEACARLLGIS